MSHSILSHSYPHLPSAFFFAGACPRSVPLAQHPATDPLGAHCFLEVSQNMALAAFISTLLSSPQVPTKKAKIKESRLQLMEDKEDPLDKFLVRNRQIALQYHPTKPTLHSQRGYRFWPSEGEPSAPAGQPPSGAGKRQPGSETDF